MSRFVSESAVSSNLGFPLVLDELENVITCSSGEKSGLFLNFAKKSGNFGSVRANVWIPSVVG